MSANIDQLMSNFLRSVQVYDDDVTLSFEDLKLKLDTCQDAQEIFNKIEACQSATTIILKGNTINIAAAEKIADALKKCHKLKRALWSDIFTGRTKAESPPALKLMCNSLIDAKVSLVELDLSDNAFGPAGADALKDFLRSPGAHTLEILKLNNGGLGIGGAKIIAESLISCWNSSKKAGNTLKLKVFVAGRNRLENEGSTALAEAFKLIGTLEEVTIPQNGIYFEGINALADAFSHNPNLKRINLEDNTLSNFGALSLAKVLHKLTRLQVLNLNDCLLRSRGAMQLAKAIKYQCEDIEEVLISGNEINKVAALEMGEALFAKRSLKKIDFGANNLGENGIEELIALFKDHDVAEKLFFSCEDEGTVSEEESDELQDMSAALDELEVEEPTEDTEIFEFNEREEIFYPLIEEFLATYDLATFRELGAEGSWMITDMLKEELQNPYYAVHVLLKISNLITKNCDDEIRDNACITCREILNVSSHQSFVDILIQKLGLSKNEDSFVSRPENLYGILHVLKNQRQLPYYQSLCDVLKFFVQRFGANDKDKAFWDDFFKSLE